nr:hypothetical protein [Bradyrhizobium symbiodeficiens]QIO98838.1 hypothetical protein HAU86_03015 [Bradyrhizobium symbiodeficiens]
MSDWEAELEAMLAQANDLSQRASLELGSQRPLLAVPALGPIPDPVPVEVDAEVSSHPTLSGFSLGEREEIKRRVESFRAHQRLFTLEREEFCTSVIAQIRLDHYRALGTPTDLEGKSALCREDMSRVRIQDP